MDTLEMDDLFGEADPEDDFPTVGPLPDLPEMEPADAMLSQENNDGKLVLHEIMMFKYWIFISQANVVYKLYIIMP